jgi:polar amino acid transport system substrate-binding protein
MMRRRTVLATLVLVASLAAGCSEAGDESMFAPATTQPPPSTTEAPELEFQDCNNDYKNEENQSALMSYEPIGNLPTPGNMPTGSTMRTIQDRGRLIAGVSADTLLFGARNSITGEIEGFDIDMVEEVAKAIFGDDANLDEVIEYRVITYAQRIPSLQNGTVDIVAHTMTINCQRWQLVAFSSQYFDSGQKVLVRNDNPAETYRDLGGQTICVASGSTNLDNINEKKDDTDPSIVVEEVVDLTDCLVAFQQGAVDGITGDDTVLAGFAAQDPYAKVIGGPFSDEPYGLAMRQDQIDFVRFVNLVLERMRTDGRWAESYQTWLGGIEGFGATEPPAALYGR